MAKNLGVLQIIGGGEWWSTANLLFLIKSGSGTGAATIASAWSNRTLTFLSFRAKNDAALKPQVSH